MSTLLDDYPIKSHDGTLARTFPFRLSDVQNVKDFGAKGDGFTDDTAAIQAAINQAFKSGLSASGVNFGSIVFFPPGIYLTSAALTFAVGNASIHLVGSGRHCTAIVGGFVGYIIDKADNGLQNLEVVTGLYVKNTLNNTGSGAIRFCAAEKGIIEDCLIQGFVGVDISANTFCARISNCDIISPFTAGTTSTVGVYAAQVGIYQTRFQGWDFAVAVYNAGFVAHGCSAEVCNNGIVIGRDRSFTINQQSGFCITGFQTEGCATAIDVTSASGGLIAGCIITGIAGEAPGGVNCQYGMRFRNASNIVVAGNTISASPVDIAGFDLSYGASASGTGNVFIGNTIVNGGWILPPAISKASFKFINCSIQALTMNFADLPGQAGVYNNTAVEGMEFDIVNDNSAGTFGATSSGGGTRHAKVRYNGTNWTVCGI